MTKPHWQLPPLGQIIYSDESRKRWEDELSERRKTEQMLTRKAEQEQAAKRQAERKAELLRKKEKARGASFLVVSLLALAIFFVVPWLGLCIGIPIAIFYFWCLADANR